MDQNHRELLTAIIDGLEGLWLENQAMEWLLERYGPKNWVEMMVDYREMPSSQVLVQKRFAPFRALIEQAQSESEALEALAPMIQGYEKPN